MLPVMLGLLGSASYAQEAPAGGDELATEELSEEEREARVAQAKELYRLGAGLYNAGRYEEAISSFQEAYALSGNEKLLFNIANAQERMGDLDGSVQSLQLYRPHADVDERVSIDLRIASLQDRIAKQPAAVDSAVTLSTPETTPEATSNVERNLTVEPVRRNRTGKWILVGTGLATGVGFGTVAAVTYLQGQDHREAGDRESYESTRTFNNVAVPVAGVGGGIALIGFVLPAKRNVSIAASPTGSSVRIRF